MGEIAGAETLGVETLDAARDSTPHSVQTLLILMQLHEVEEHEEDLAVGAVEIRGTTMLLLLLAPGIYQDGQKTIVI